MRPNARGWAAAGVVSIAVVAAIGWYVVGAKGRADRAAAAAREAHAAAGGGTDDVIGDEARESDGGAGRLPQSEVYVLDPLVRRAPTAAPGTVTVGSGEPRVVTWELAFPRGVWSLRFVLGSPNVALQFLDLSGTVSADCHALSAITERGPAPFPNARFDAMTHTAQLADMPLEVVEALTRSRELTLVACDTRFTLDDTQQRKLIEFYVQTAGVILDGVSADAGAAVETR